MFLVACKKEGGIEYSVRPAPVSELVFWKAKPNDSSHPLKNRELRLGTISIELPGKPSEIEGFLRQFRMFVPEMMEREPPK